MRGVPEEIPRAAHGKGKQTAAVSYLPQAGSREGVLCHGQGRVQGAGKSECGMDHHPLLYRALIVARQFQVQAATQSYPAGSQQIQLRQQVMIGKTEVSLCFVARIMPSR
jgi:hypothetical protein